jgi:hypothetical protein
LAVAPASSRMAPQQDSPWQLPKPAVAMKSSASPPVLIRTANEEAVAVDIDCSSSSSTLKSLDAEVRLNLSNTRSLAERLHSMLQVLRESPDSKFLDSLSTSLMAQSQAVQDMLLNLRGLRGRSVHTEACASPAESGVLDRTRDADFSPVQQQLEFNDGFDVENGFTAIRLPTSEVQLSRGLSQETLPPFDTRLEAYIDEDDRRTLIASESAFAAACQQSAALPLESATSRSGTRRSTSPRRTCIDTPTSSSLRKHAQAAKPTETAWYPPGRSKASDRTSSRRVRSGGGS